MRQPPFPSGSPSNADALFAAGNFEEAARWFGAASEREPNRADYAYKLAYSLQQMGRDAKSAFHYRRAIQLAPKDPNSYIGLGQLMREHGNLAGAEECYRKTLGIDPSLVRVRTLLSATLADQGRKEEAERELYRILDFDAASASAHAFLGFALQGLGRFEEAEKAFRRALDLQPSMGSAYYGITQGRKIRVEDEPMIERMRTLVNAPQLSEDEHRNLRFGLGKAYDDLGRYEEAMIEFDEANRLAEEGLRAARGPFRSDFYARDLERTRELFNKGVFEERGTQGNNSTLPVLIVGMMRSGTTLTEQILASHPKGAGAGELKFWLQKARQLLDQNSHPLPENVALVGEEYLALLRTIAPGKERVTDKMPSNYMLLGAFHLVFPKAKIIHCRRNAVDNCLSIYMKAYDFSPDFGHNRENIVFMYKQYERFMEHWRSVLPPGTILDVQYEELVGDFESVARKIVGFCGLEWDDGCLHHERTDRRIQTASLWQVRQPIYKTSVERWRNYEPWLGDFKELL